MLRPALDTLNGMYIKYGSWSQSVWRVQWGLGVVLSADIKFILIKGGKDLCGLRQSGKNL